MKRLALTGELPAPRRDLIFEAFCQVCAVLPAELTRSARGAINRAVAEVRAVNSQLTPEEIRRRAVRYRQLYPNASLTPPALARHWAECWAPKPKPMEPIEEPSLPEPPGDWRSLIASNEYLAGVPIERKWNSIPVGYQKMVYRALNRR